MNGRRFTLIASFAALVMSGLAVSVGRAQPSSAGCSKTFGRVPLKSCYADCDTYCTDKVKCQEYCDGNASGS